MVWFYRLYQSKTRPNKIPFQSHFGLILSRQKTSNDGNLWVSFNPILVWFYRCPAFSSPHLFIDLSIPFWSDFILLNRAVLLSNKVNFQSHFGLILSFFLNSINDYPDNLSIPFWSDFISLQELSLQVYKIAFNPTMVWFYPAYFIHVFMCIRKLSIPLWSDFIGV